MKAIIKTYSPDIMKYFNSILLVFLLLFLVNRNYAQNTSKDTHEKLKQFQDSIEFIYQNLRKSLKKNGYTNPQERMKLIELLHATEQYKNTNSEIDSLIDYVKGSIFLDFYNIHQLNKNYDSISYYIDTILSTVQNKNILARTYRVKAMNYRRLLDYENYFLYMNQSLEFAKDTKSKELELTLLIDLSTFFRKSGRIDLAKDLQKQMHSNVGKNSSIYLKFKIARNDYFLLREEKKFKEAHALLKSFANTSITENRLQRATYNGLLADSYRRLKKYDSAFYFLKKNQSFVKDPYSYYNKLADIAYQSGDYKKALMYLNEVPYTKSIMNSYRSYVFLSNAYKIHKAIGNKNEAFDYLEKYLEAEKKRREYLNKKTVAIFNYEIKKNTEIARLNEEKNTQAKLAIQNKARYQYLFIIGMLTVVIVCIIVLALFKRAQQKKNFAVERQSEINRLKTQYIENITHEFKSPVSVNLGYLDLIKINSVNPKKVNDYVEILQGINSKLIKTFDDLLTFIKFNKDDNNLHQYYRSTEQNLYDYLDTTLRKFEYNCSIKNLSIQLTTNVVPGYFFDFDYLKLDKILDNLLNNAFKFSTSGGTIYVTFLLHKENFSIQVKDEGIGIDQELHDKIFQRFYQVKETDYNGFGIGLFLIKGIIESLDGDIQVDSELNKGASFTINIPLKDIELSEGIGPLKSTEYFRKDISEVANPNAVKILIVENQLEMIMYLNHVFAIDYYCDFAQDGEQAYDLIQKNTYSLIISDYKMPVMDGLELQAKLSKNSKTSQIPFILISASKLGNKLDHLAKNYSFEFLKKPFTQLQLNSLIEKFIGYKNKAQKVISTSDSLFLNNDSISTFLQRTNTYILDNLSNEKLKIEEIASNVGYSQKQFTDIIKGYTNLNPNKIVLEIRLLKSYEFIINKQFETIGEIMATVGINSRSYFYKVFEQRFQIKPGEMMKKNKEYAHP